MSKKKKIEKELAKLKVQEENDSQVVQMKFSEDKFYNDQSIAHFEKGKVYEIRGGDQIMRWLKRGGEIVKGELEIQEQEVNQSVLADKVEVAPGVEPGDSKSNDDGESLEVELDAE